MDTILALDLGTTGNRAILYDQAGQPVASAYQEFTQHYPKPGWVEHDALEIWQVAQSVMGQVLAEGHTVKAMGITNQRETTVIWDRKTGEPIHYAIVWQCRRTSYICDELKAQGLGDEIKKITGLPCDAYFSGTKIQWLLDHVPGAREKALAGRLCFGTIDTWILWQLTQGASHATDFTNASRTMLFDIDKRQWHGKLLEAMYIPLEVLPAVQKSSGFFGETRGGEGIPEGIPILGMAGDQQAALFGQACAAPGDVKNTYGTGCFMILNTGAGRVDSPNGLVTTLACDPAGDVCYALEGAIFVAGAAIQWLRDELKVIQSAPETETVCRATPDTHGVYVVPAFAGLGAPYWRQDARGTITGLTRGANMQHIIRATVESLAYQTQDVLLTMAKDAQVSLQSLKVDGGACANDFLMQFQADISGLSIVRPRIIETTSLGAAYLAGLACGFWSGLDAIQACWQEDCRFEPAMEDAQRAQLYDGWQKAVGQIL